jgi:hypothetical protein
VSSGATTITAQVDGMSATITVRVVPDYHGHWEGLTRVTDCTDDGDFSDLCAEVIGGALLLSTSISQTRDAVAVDLDFDGAKGRVSTTIQPNGRLLMSGPLTLTIDGIVFEVSLEEWDTTSADNQSMTGRYRLEVRHALLNGSWKFQGELATVEKISGTPGLSASIAPTSGATRERLFGRLRQATRRK